MHVENSAGSGNQKSDRNSSLGRTFRLYRSGADQRTLFYITGKSKTSQYQCENLSGAGSADRIANGEILTLADSRYVLAEFYQGIGYSGIFRAVQRFTQSGYSPIIAHAERYEALKDIGRLEELRKQGAYIQLNFRAIGGKWHDFTTRWCRKALKEGFVHFVGTDMHNMRTRKPETESAVVWMEKHLEPDYVKKLFLKNPEKILRNERL